jgi:uncharacterized membrane protein YoaK (UPF0700 family)
MATEHTPHPRVVHAEGQSGSTGLALLLAAVSGYVDGVGVMYITGVFVSFMSGNTTVSGVALGTADWANLAHAGAAIPLYLAAVTTGALVFARWPRARPALHLAVVVLLAGFVLVAQLQGPATPEGWVELLLVALLVLPMGLLNMTLRKVGATTVGLGYITGTLVSLGESLAHLLRSRHRADWVPVGLFGGLWAGFFLGAACGAFLTVRFGSWATVVPLVVVMALLVIDLRNARRATD